MINKKVVTKDAIITVKSNFSINKWVKELGETRIKSALKKYAQYMKIETDKRFKGEYGPDGKKWKKLSETTMLTRRSTKILKKTRGLMRSVKVMLDNYKLVIYSNKPYAAVHQRGRTIRTTRKQDLWLWHNLFKRKGAPYYKKQRIIRIPKRPFMGFNKNNNEHLRKITLQELKETEKMGKGAL
jgi:phage virion morphogenesis protein